MKTQQGFTLLEVLIVVVIAVSVAAFAVPAYKKTQDRNRYSAATGSLIDLANGVRMLRADMATESPSSLFPSGSTPSQVSYSWQDNTSSNYNTSKTTLNSTYAPYALFSRNYMSPIPFDGSASSLSKGYAFYVCPQDSSSSSACCGSNSEVIVCMQDSSYASRPTKGQYYGATLTRNGNINRLTK